MRGVACVTLLIACAVAGGGGEVRAHGTHDRLHEVEARASLTVEPARILLEFEQTFTVGMSRFVCTEIDRDRDTKLAPGEVDAWARQIAKELPERCPLEVDWQKVAPKRVTPEVRGVPATVPVTDAVAPPIVLRLGLEYPLEVPAGAHVLNLLSGTTAAYMGRTDLKFVAPVRALGSHAGELTPDGASITNYVQIDGQPASVSCVFSTGAERAAPGVRPAVGALIGVALFALGLAAGRRRARRER